MKIENTHTQAQQPPRVRERPVARENSQPQAVEKPRTTETPRNQGQVGRNVDVQG